MKVHNEAWRTVYDPNFCEGNFLYHFTDIEKVIKILYGDSLKFSKICTTNDTLESKPKMDIPANQENDLFEIIRHLRDINKRHVQILCFTKDVVRKSTNCVSGKKVYTDYSGRGFALPRMWAQYARNNTGVCLVFDKNLLIELIQNSLGISLIHHGSVQYVSKFENFKYNPVKLKKLLDQVNQYHNAMQQSFVDLNFLKSNIEFVEYNYFSKLDDWAGENEYRFLTYGEEDYFIKQIKDALIGIVIGENIDPAYEEIIKVLCNDICEIKKISFTYKGCQISSII